MAKLQIFRSAIKNNGTPRVITLDAYAASRRAIAELKSAGTLPRRVRIRSSKYLNNVVEQDHRRIKQRIRPMCVASPASYGIMRVDSARATNLAASPYQHPGRSQQAASEESKVANENR